MQVLLRKDRWIVIALWIFFEIIWYAYLGVQFKLESVKYIEEAQYILQYHHFSQFRYLFYFTTIAVIIFSFLLHIGLYGALFIIMLINLCSYLYFFKALKTLFRDRLSPFLVIGILLSFWPYQSWTLYLFTECLFYSLMLILFSHLIFFRQLNFRFLIITALLLFLLVVSRPLGILLILPTLLFIFFKLSKRQRWIVFFAGLLFLVLLNFVMQVVFTTTPDWNMTRALTEDSIICDMPRANAKAQLDLTNSPNQFYQLFYYVTHNFSHFAGLALIRLKYFFTMVRSYYSSFHNLYLIAYLTIIYATILLGIKRIVRFVPVGLSVFLFSSIAFFAITVALQCDDYHNRFALALMPFYVTMAVVAWRNLISRISSSKSHKGLPYQHKNVSSSDGEV